MEQISDVTYKFMAEVRSYLGLESVSIKNNEIELVDFEVFPLYDKYVYSMVFHRIESNKIGETMAEMEQDYLETVEIFFNFYRVLGENGYKYELEVGKSKDGEPLESVRTRVKYNRKPKKRKADDRLPEALMDAEQKSDAAVEAGSPNFDLGKMFNM